MTTLGQPKAVTVVCSCGKAHRMHPNMILKKCVCGAPVRRPVA